MSTTRPVAGSGPASPRHCARLHPAHHRRPHRRSLRRRGPGRARRRARGAGRTERCGQVIAAALRIPHLPARLGNVALLPPADGGRADRARRTARWPGCAAASSATSSQFLTAPAARPARCEVVAAAARRARAGPCGAARDAAADRAAAPQHRRGAVGRRLLGAVRRRAAAGQPGRRDRLGRRGCCCSTSRCRRWTRRTGRRALGAGRVADGARRRGARGLPRLRRDARAWPPGVV